MDAEKFRNEMQELYPQYDFSKCNYTKAIDKVTVIVPEYGEVLVVARTLKSGKWKPTKWTTQKFIVESKKRFPDKDFDYSKVNYINNDTKVIIGCPIHGDFEIRPGDFLRQTGCPLCKPRSLREIFIADWLNSKDILFIHNHKIILSNNRLAFIDFVIGNVYLEYNGIQHYKDVKFFKKGHNIVPFSLENQQLRDKLVQEYCDKNNIKLVWFNYKQTDQEIIKELEHIINI